MPIETKDSYRWLENLRQSIALVGAPERCLHVGDRESDIYELYCTAQDLGTSFIVRGRRTGWPSGLPMLPHTILLIASLPAAPWAGRHRITVGYQDETTWLQVKFAAIRTLPPVGKQKRYSPQVLTYIHALEEDPPPGREPIDWKLVNNLLVEDLSVAVEKLGWHALRWKAEVFHRAMKSGCRAEEGRPAVVSWRIFFVTMSARANPDAAPDSLRRDHCARPDRRARTRPRLQPPTLAAYLLQIAMLGGDLARKHDPPPGNMAVWRGMTRLHDIAFGISIGSREKARIGACIRSSENPASSKRSSGVNIHLFFGAS
ncbi:hypothetical protein NKH28_33265 [Mesorhizobium sp. M1227]|uniref:hypothetical protein n=1 Tax=Mesorhizobium sp. M1227 TaxID=2957071 RepID=UPI00333DA697